MKKFKFRLERVLQYRNIVKDELRRDLLLKNYKLRQDFERLEALEEAERANTLRQGPVFKVQEVHLAGLFAARLQDAAQPVVIHTVIHAVIHAVIYVVIHGGPLTGGGRSNAHVGISVSRSAPLREIWIWQ